MERVLMEPCGGFMPGRSATRLLKTIVPKAPALVGVAESTRSGPARQPHKVQKRVCRGSARSTPVTLVCLLIINGAPIHPQQRPDLANKVYGSLIRSLHVRAFRLVLETKAHSLVLRGAEGMKS